MEISLADVNNYISLIQTNFSNAFHCEKTEQEMLLINSWHRILKNYPKEIVDVAVINVIKHAEFAPHIGTIVKEIERMQDALAKDDNALWSELTSALKEVDDCVYRFRFTFRERNGLTQGENARRRVTEIYGGLSDELKSYLHNESSLIELSKYNTEQLSYERGRFMRQMPIVRDHMKTTAAMPENLKVLLAGICKPLPCGGREA